MEIANEIMERVEMDITVYCETTCIM